MKRLAVILALVMGARAWGADLAAVETPLVRLSMPVIPDSLVLSADSSRLVFASRAENATVSAASGNRAPVRYNVDGKYLGAFDALSPAFFSGNSAHVTWGGQKEGQWHLFLDDRELCGDAHALPGGPVAFSADGQHTAWIVNKSDQFLVMVDDRPWPPIEMAATAGLLAFSPDSQHVSCLARIRGVWTLIVDGKALATPAPVGSRPLEHFGTQYLWWPDSAGIAYQAYFTFSHWQVFSEGLDGTFVYTSTPHEGLLKDTPVFSRDGKHFAFAAQEKGKWTVITDTRESEAPAFDTVRVGEMAYVTAGEGEPAQVVYLAQRGRNWQLYVNHAAVKEGAFDAVTEGSFLVSADGKHYAVAGVRGGKGMVVKDGQVVGTHDELGANTFAFSPDSQHLGYAARGAGRAGGAKQWAFWVDGAAGSGFAAVGAAPPAFSGDSGRIAFTAQTAPSQWRLIVGKDGGQQSKVYEGFLKGSHVTWRGDGTLVTMGIRGNTATRVEVKVP